MAEEEKQTLITTEDQKQGDMFPAELLALERDRLSSQDKRTEIARAAINAQSESDKRQYDYHMTRLANEEIDNKRRFVFASRFLWVVFGVIATTFIFLILIAFFGNPTQTTLAMRILSTLSHLITGAGILIFGKYAWKHISNHSDNE